MQQTIQHFFDPQTSTFSYLVYQGLGSSAIIIDSVLNYDHRSGRTHTHSADQLMIFVKEQQLKVEWILETHAHADHLSAAPYLKQHLGGQIVIGKNISQIQGVFKSIFHLEDDFAVDGSQFDYLIANQEKLAFGNLTLQAMAVPGHTPACMAYVVGDAIFVGDTMFMPDVGSARCDFPGGDAHQLYRSVQKILAYPLKTQLFMCHDYPPNDRPVSYVTTVEDQKKYNIHLQDHVSEEEFVSLRQARDQGLEMPTLILPAIQINIRAGNFPPAESNGQVFLKIPLNSL
jgi:glyoxylase-like metal-dependent hydrolase (beta-lactamase superfamily II)